MHDRHTNRKRYFNEQALSTKKYVIPYIQNVMPINENTSVFEIGCGEGGNLVPFLELGCKRILGVDLGTKKIEKAKAYFADHPKGKNTEFILEDVYNMNPEETGEFDIIIMKDVIEHIHNQEKFMAFVKKFLKPDGKFFLGFPPWYNPFGGHQQMCKSKVLSKLPYFHILPRPIYGGILKAFGETDKKVENLLEIKDTGISIDRFERIIKDSNYQKDRRTLFFINPNYDVKFGLKPRKAWSIITAIPFFRNFFVTAAYYLISKK